MYDQVKCDGVVTKISIVTAIGAGGIPAVQVVTAYDRMGTQSEVTNTVQPQLTTSSLFDFSSASIVSAINNSVAKTSRSCWASDIQERSVFHDCSVTSQDGGPYFDNDFNASPAKVGYFSPLTMFGLRLAAAPTTNTTVQVLLDQTYYFTFRNPKYGGSATSVSTRSIESTSGVPVMPGGDFTFKDLDVRIPINRPVSYTASSITPITVSDVTSGGLFFYTLIDGMWFSAQNAIATSITGSARLIFAP